MERAASFVFVAKWLQLKELQEQVGGISISISKIVFFGCTFTIGGDGG